MKTSSCSRQVLVVFASAVLLSANAGGWVNHGTVAARQSAAFSSMPRAEDGSRQHAIAQADEAYARLPLSFEANIGQADPRVKFISHARGSTFLLTSAGAVLHLRRALDNSSNTKRRRERTTTIKMSLLGARRSVDVHGSERLPGVSNYFCGNDRRRWRSGAPNFSRVEYTEIYPGVNLVYYGNRGQLEYDFEVARGADPGRIQLGFDGVKRLAIDKDGDLALGTSVGEIRMHKPDVYQMTANGKEKIDARYVRRGRDRIGFEIGGYDHEQALVIDPVLSYSSYLGGTNTDQGRSITLDSAGNAYVTGSTFSFNFPITIDSYDTTYGNSSDAFVTKINADGSAILYSTYLGGGLQDAGLAIAIDSSGNAYVCGATTSTDFPTTAGAYQTTLKGGGFSPGDAFVTKLNSTGTALVYSTYVGGTSSDQANSIAVNSVGNAYITGYTSSTDFPTTAGVFQTTSGGSSDVFVAQFNGAGTDLVYSTYLGGSSADQGNAIKVDSSENAYVAGTTTSNNFDVTPGAYQTTYGGASGFSAIGDCFVTRLNPTATALVYSTYIGGSGNDGAFGLALADSGEVYLTGVSGSGNFPTTAGAVRVGNGGIAKSTNSAGSWASMNSGVTNFSETAVIIDPSSPNNLFAASSGGGVFKSTNNGANWAASNSGLTDLFIRSLAIDSASTSILYLGTSSRGIFRSTDSGATWRAINNGQNGMTVNTLTVDPSNANIVYAGTTSGISKTTNGGANWTTVNTGLSGLTVSAFVIDSVATSTVYAGTNAGVSKSTNGGANWSNTNLTGTSIQALAIDPSVTTTIYAGGGSGILKTTDGGLTWFGINTGLSNRNVTAIAVSPADPAMIFAGTSDGLFKSTNGGINWGPANLGLAGALINAIAIDPVTTSTIYTGSLGGSNDAFVTKLNSAGDGLAYSTYLGGSGTDQGLSIVADPAGDAYVTGLTNSQNFPTTPGLFQSNGYDSDAFVSKLNPAGSALVYSTYLGGLGFDEGYGIAVDSVGSAFVTGLTDSRNFPTTGGAFQPVMSGFDEEAFVAKLNVAPNLLADLSISMLVSPGPYPAGSSMTYSITVTNNGPEKATAIVVSDDLPPSLVFNFCSSSFSCFHTGNSVTFGINSMDPGASVSATIFAFVGCSIGTTEMITNSATVTSASTDPNLSDNSAMTTITATRTPLTLGSTSASFSVLGGSNFVTVNQGNSSCPWTSQSNDPWITITFSTNCCNGFVNYTVDSNPGPPRMGSMTIAGQTFTVSQGACSYSIGPTAASVLEGGGGGSFNIITQSTCAWTAVSNDSWINVTSASSGTGSVLVNYAVDPNPTFSQRIGSITAANQVFTVKQSGFPTVGLSYYKTDFDNDGKTEIGFYRAGLWGLLKSGQAYSFGSPQFFSWGGLGLQPICADFDGDGNADIANIVAPSGGASGAYAILKSTTSYSQALFVPAGYPSLGDTPVIGDVDGDGKADPGIWRESQGVWIIPKSSANYGSFLFSSWGITGDIPVLADFDGDRKADIGFYRDGLWGILMSSQGYSTGSPLFLSWGGLGLQPVIGDFDGDGRADVGYIVPPGAGQSAAYAILKSSTGYSFAPGQPLFVSAGFPSLGDTPVIGDFDGDGKSDPGIWRESQAVWMIPLSSSNYASFLFTQWGQTGDVPIPNTTRKH